MVLKELETSQPNIGSGKEVYAHCPNCSKMYLSENDRGRPQTLPQTCERCECPMVAGDESKAYMDLAAEENHDEAVSLFGRQYRGETPVGLSRTEMRAEIMAEVRAEIAAEAKAKTAE